MSSTRSATPPPAVTTGPRPWTHVADATRFRRTPAVDLPRSRIREETDAERPGRRSGRGAKPARSPGSEGWGGEQAQGDPKDLLCLRDLRCEAGDPDLAGIDAGGADRRAVDAGRHCHADGLAVVAGDAAAG